MELLDGNNRKEVFIQELDCKSLIYTDFTSQQLTDFFSYIAKDNFSFEATKKYLEDHNLLEKANDMMNNFDSQNPTSYIDWAYFPIMESLNLNYAGTELPDKSEEDITEDEYTQYDHFCESILTVNEYIEIIIYHNLLEPQLLSKLIKFYKANLQ